MKRVEVLRRQLAPEPVSVQQLTRGDTSATTSGEAQRQQVCAQPQVAPRQPRAPSIDLSSHNFLSPHVLCTLDRITPTTPQHYTYDRTPLITSREQYEEMWRHSIEVWVFFMGGGQRRVLCVF